MITTSSVVEWGEVTVDPPGQRRSLMGRATELALIGEFLGVRLAHGEQLRRAHATAAPEHS